MANPSLRTIVIVGATLVSGAALAQFGQIFQPPRPPADIGRPGPPPPVQGRPPLQAPP